MKYLVSLFFLMFMFSISTYAETKLIKYKNYQIPVQTSDFRECTDGKPRVIVSSDISNNGDPDDVQSMIHLLASSNQFKTLGLISTPGGDVAVGNEKVHMQNMVNAYALDYARSNPASLRALGYPKPSELSQVIRQGAKGITKAPGLIYNATNPLHQGAKLILEEAQKVLDGTNCGPIYVLVWGSIPDVAIALKESKRRVAAGIDKQGIEKALRVYFIANVNKTSGQPAYSYIFDNFLKKDLLWFIQSEQTFRGANGKNETTREAFLNRISKPATNFNQSCMSYVLRRTSDKIKANVNQRHLRIKIGDTPSLLYVMNGDLDDPTSPSWGGQYKQVPGYTNWWVDGHVTNVDAIKNSVTNFNLPQVRIDLATVASRLPEAQNDWVNSMNRFTASLPSACPGTVNGTLN